MNTEFGSNNYGGSGTYNASVISACEQRGWGWVAYSFDGGPNGPYDLITDTTTYNPAPSGVPVESGLALN
jgi:hypothetical protein